MFDHVKITRGSEGRIVKAVQSALNQRGENIAVDGKCGTATLRAAARALCIPAPKVLGRDELARLGLRLVYGIDLSGHNEGGNKKPVDFGKVKAAGVSFVWLKATEGTGYLNREAYRQADECQERGIPVGCYHFGDPSAKRPLDLSDLTADANAEARHYLETRAAYLGGIDSALILPDVLDLERQYQHKLSAIAWSAIGGTSAARAERCALWALTWLETVREATGRIPAIYTARWAWQGYFARAPEYLRDHLMCYRLWLASYNSGAGPARTIPGWDWTVWQFTGSGTIPGVDGKCDINVCLAEDLGL